MLLKTKFCSVKIINNLKYKMDIKNLSVINIKKELKDLGAKTTGKKAELQRR